MNDVLKRRLIGAAVLLALAFGVASLLPDPEPRARPGAVVTYDLRTGRPVREPPEPSPAATADATTPQPDASASAPPAARPSLKVDETLDGGAGEWYVQVGSFESQANARKALQRLYGFGLPTVIQSVAVGNTLWYRVRVGPYPAETAAQDALARIHKHGYSTAKLVPPETAPGKGRN